MKRSLVTIFVAGLLAAAGSLQAEGLSPDLNRVLSRVQSLSHGVYSQKEWDAAVAELDRVVAGAEEARDWNQAVEASVIKAMMLADMKRNYQGALDLLQAARARYDEHRPTAMRKVFVREAQAYGSLGDEAGVKRVMDAYRASPYYDAESYAFTLGEGRNTPMTIVRPSAAGPNSTAETAMRVARQQAQFATGALLPAFSVTDADGHVRSTSDYRGKVLLVDFWVRGWTPWLRDLANVKAFEKKYGKDGFAVLGICLEPDATGALAFAREQGLHWPIVTGDLKLARQLGIYGSATTLLVDRNGQIVGRNLRGADLAAAAKRALEQ
jgi:peroxiredoxin